MSCCYVAGCGDESLLPPVLRQFWRRTSPTRGDRSRNFSFLALTLQMGHTVQDRLDDYWTKMEQLRTPFYGQMMVRARYCHILRFLHFTDNNRNGVDRTDDRLWKIWDLFEIIRTNFSKFYNPSKHLAVDEVIVKFKGRVLFKQYIPKKRKRFGIKMFKLCDCWIYIWHECLPW